MTGAGILPPNANPNSGGILISDFEQFVKLLSGWEGTIEQLSCGRFQGLMRMAHGRQMHAHLAETNQSIMLRGRERSGVCTITLVLPASSACLWHRRRLESGSIVVRSGLVEVDHCSSRNAVNMSIAFPEATLLRAIRCLTRTDLKSLTWLAPKPSTGIFFNLEKGIRRYLKNAFLPAFSKSLDAKVLEDECLNAVVASIQPEDSRRGFELSLPARTNIVRQAEDVMRAHLNIAIGEVDLCEMLDVSGRTLRTAFHERYGLGPMAYFQTLRLNAVRNELITGDPETVSVTHVARKLGFGHLGKFAGYYRRLFGELPSKTLRRQPRLISR